MQSEEAAAAAAAAGEEKEESAIGSANRFVGVDSDADVDDDPDFENESYGLESIMEALDLQGRSTVPIDYLVDAFRGEVDEDGLERLVGALEGLDEHASGEISIADFRDFMLAMVEDGLERTPTPSATPQRQREGEQRGGGGGGGSSTGWGSEGVVGRLNLNHHLVDGEGVAAAGASSSTSTVFQTKTPRHNNHHHHQQQQQQQHQRQQHHHRRNPSSFSTDASDTDDGRGFGGSWERERAGVSSGGNRRRRATRTTLGTSPRTYLRKTDRSGVDWGSRTSSSDALVEMAGLRMRLATNQERCQNLQQALSTSHEQISLYQDQLSKRDMTIQRLQTQLAAAVVNSHSAKTQEASSHASSPVTAPEISALKSKRLDSGSVSRASWTHKDLVSAIQALNVSYEQATATYAQGCDSANRKQLGGQRTLDPHDLPAMGPQFELLARRSRLGLTQVISDESLLQGEFLRDQNHDEINRSRERVNKTSGDLAYLESQATAFVQHFHQQLQRLNAMTDLEAASRSFQDNFPSIRDLLKTVTGIDSGQRVAAMALSPSESLGFVVLLLQREIWWQKLVHMHRTTALETTQRLAVALENSEMLEHTCRQMEGDAQRLQHLLDDQVQTNADIGQLLHQAQSELHQREQRRPSSGSVGADQGGRATPSLEAVANHSVFAQQADVVGEALFDKLSPATAQPEATLAAAIFVGEVADGDADHLSPSLFDEVQGETFDSPAATTHGMFELEQQTLANVDDTDPPSATQVHEGESALLHGPKGDAATVGGEPVETATLDKELHCNSSKGDDAHDQSCDALPRSVENESPGSGQDISQASPNQDHPPPDTIGKHDAGEGNALPRIHDEQEAIAKKGLCVPTKSAAPPPSSQLDNDSPGGLLLEQAKGHPSKDGKKAVQEHAAHLASNDQLQSLKAQNDRLLTKLEVMQTQLDKSNRRAQACQKEDVHFRRDRLGSVSSIDSHDSSASLRVLKGAGEYQGDGHDNNAPLSSDAESVIAVNSEGASPPEVERQRSILFGSRIVASAPATTIKPVADLNLQRRHPREWWSHAFAISKNLRRVRSDQGMRSVQVKPGQSIDTAEIGSSPLQARSSSFPTLIGRDSDFGSNRHHPETSLRTHVSQPARKWDRALGWLRESQSYPRDSTPFAGARTARLSKPQSVSVLPPRGFQFSALLTYLIAECKRLKLLWTHTQTRVARWNAQVPADQAPASNSAPTVKKPQKVLSGPNAVSTNSTPDVQSSAHRNLNLQLPSTVWASQLLQLFSRRMVFLQSICQHLYFTGDHLRFGFDSNLRNRLFAAGANLAPVPGSIATRSGNPDTNGGTGTPESRDCARQHVRTAVVGGSSPAGPLRPAGARHSSPEEEVLFSRHATRISPSGAMRSNFSFGSAASRKRCVVVLTTHALYEFSSPPYTMPTADRVPLIDIVAIVEDASVSQRALLLCQCVYSSSGDPAEAAAAVLAATNRAPLTHDAKGATEHTGMASTPVNSRVSLDRCRDDTLYLFDSDRDQREFSCWLHFRRARWYQDAVAAPTTSSPSRLSAGSKSGKKHHKSRRHSRCASRGSLDDKHNKHRCRNCFNAEESKKAHTGRAIRKSKPSRTQIASVDNGAHTSTSVREPEHAGPNSHATPPRPRRHPTSAKISSSFGAPGSSLDHIFIEHSSAASSYADPAPLPPIGMTTGHGEFVLRLLPTAALHKIAAEDNAAKVAGSVPQHTRSAGGLFGLIGDRVSTAHAAGVSCWRVTWDAKAQSLDLGRIEAIYRPQRCEDVSSVKGTEANAAKSTPTKTTIMSRLRSWFSPTPAKKPEMGSECNHPTALLPKQGSGASVDAQAKSTAGSPLPSQSDQQSHDDGSVHQGNESTTDAVSSGATAIPIKKTLGVATDTGHDATLGRGALPRIVERLRRRRVMADSAKNAAIVGTAQANHTVIVNALAQGV